MYLLTHRGPLMPCGNLDLGQHWISIGSGNGLLPEGTKPLPETMLTHWGRVTHICISKLIIIGSNNGLSPCRRQDIIGTNAGIVLIGPIVTNCSEMLIEIHTFSFKKIHLKMSSGKRWPFFLGLNMLNYHQSSLPDLPVADMQVKCFCFY